MREQNSTAVEQHIHYSCFGCDHATTGCRPKSCNYHIHSELGILFLVGHESGIVFKLLTVTHC